MVTFLVLVRPGILKLTGTTDLEMPAHPGVLVDPLANRGDRRHFMRVRVDATGQVHAAGYRLRTRWVRWGRPMRWWMPPETTLAEGAAVTVLRFVSRGFLSVFPDSWCRPDPAGSGLPYRSG